MDGPSTLPRFEVRIRIEGGTCVLRLVGDLDATTSVVLDGVGRAVPSEAGVEIDAAELSFCDSVGLRAIIVLAETRPDRRVRVRGATLALTRLLDVLGQFPSIVLDGESALDSELDVVARESEALRGHSARIRARSDELRGLSERLRA